MAAIAELQQEIEARLSSGEPLQQVEHDVIEPCKLTEDDKSALWLYGWASMETGRFRSARAAEAFLC